MYNAVQGYGYGHLGYGSSVDFVSLNQCYRHRYRVAENCARNRILMVERSVGMSLLWMYLASSSRIKAQIICQRFDPSIRRVSDT